MDHFAKFKHDAAFTHQKKRDPMTTPSTPANFETELKRLSEIVEQLEKGDLPLEQSLVLFEEGVKLTRAAQTRLDGAQKRIDELLKVDASGEVHSTPFSADEGA